MKKSALGKDWPPGHRLQLASIGMPFLGLSAAIGFLYFTPGGGGLNHWPTISRQDYWELTQALWLLGIAGVIGLVAAGKSIARGEEPGSLAVLGLLLNVPPVLLWLLRVAERLMAWAGVR